MKLSAVSILLSLCFSAFTIAATPDQVLVLYNADYTIDLDGSEPGQDSLEVAAYYVRRHTCAETGRKPYMLGLRCVHGKDHLNQVRLPEYSNDNYWGLVYIGREQPPEWPALDSRAVDILLTKEEVANADLDTAVIAISKGESRADAQVVFQKGTPRGLRSLRAAASDDGSHSYTFSAREFAPGRVNVWFEVDDKQGQSLKRIHRTYHDFNDFSVSTTGSDGIRDDLNYLEDIELPVKAFLEDPANALPDGTLLRDHILYIVVVHGLPKAVESFYGIGRGPGGNLVDWGDGSSLQQRLMMMYYDVTEMDFRWQPAGAIMQKQRLPGGEYPAFGKHHRELNRQDGVRPVVICNTLCFTLIRGYNPYMHPETFRAGMGGLPDMNDQKRYKDPDDRLLPVLSTGQHDLHPRLTSELRSTWPRQNFLYWAMRIDAEHPEIAKAQVDSAIYGSRYFTPQMGTCYHQYAGPSPIQPSIRAGLDELKALGFKLQPQLNRPPNVIERPLIAGAPFHNGPKYYEEGVIIGWNGILPGGITWAIRSFNRWKQDSDQFASYMPKMIEAGATFTAGLGAYGGAHITSASWFCDRVFFHHLFRGHQLGETLMMSSYYLDWVIAYVGDPLYQPNVLVNQPDTTPPLVCDTGPIVEVLPAKNSYCAIVTVPLVQTPDNPEMAEIAAVYPGTDGTQFSRNWRFSARPQIVLRNLERGKRITAEITLTDPYGNATEVFYEIDVPEAQPAGVRVKQLLEEERVRPIVIARYWRADNPPAITAEAGEIEIEFTPLAERFNILRLSGFEVNSRRLLVGGGVAVIHEPLVFEPGRRYHLIARWRRRPVTREIYIVADDGTEFLAAANNLTPWIDTPIHGTTDFGDRSGEIEVHRLVIVDSANPAPDEHTQPYVKRFPLEEFRKRNNLR